MKSKNIVIFGANGKVGKLLTEYALADGHNVTAFIHRHHDLPDHPRLTIAKGDIYKQADVRMALKSADVVVSALSSWGTPKKDVLSTAMANIIPAMQELGITRIISLTGADARATGDQLSVLHNATHMAIGIIGGKVLQDGEGHIEVLEKSGLDWTVIRSPVMRSSTNTKYKITMTRPMPWATVARQAVARAMIDQAASKDSLGAVYIK